MLTEAFDKITDEALEKMTVAELDALQAEVSDVLYNRIKRLRTTITAVKERKVASDKVDKMIEKMPEADKQALLQKLKGSKVDSEESVRGSN